MAENISIAQNPLQMSPLVFGEDKKAIPNGESVQKQEIANEILENKVRKVASDIKSAGRDIPKKAALMIQLKFEDGTIDLRKFVDMYLGGNNYEDIENFEIANEVENHFNLKKTLKNVGKGASKVAKGVAKVTSSKLGSSIIAGAVSIVGTPAAGAGVAAALGGVRKVMDKAKSLNIPTQEIKALIAEPKKMTAVQIQSLVPENAVHSTLSKLVPLEGSMKSALAAKGVTTNQTTSLEDLTTMFHDKIVLGKDNFDTSWYKSDAMYFEPAHYFDQNNFDYSKAGSMVNDIIAFFDKAKKNPETPIEAKAGNDVKKIEKALSNDAQKEISQKVENAQIIDKGFSVSTIVIFAVIAVVLFIVMKK